MLLSSERNRPPGQEGCGGSLREKMACDVIQAGDIPEQVKLGSPQKQQSTEMLRAVTPLWVISSLWHAVTQKWRTNGEPKRKHRPPHDTGKAGVSLERMQLSGGAGAGSVGSPGGQRAHGNSVPAA